VDDSRRQYGENVWAMGGVGKDIATDSSAIGYVGDAPLNGLSPTTLAMA
jgi:hypothetical protein